VFVWLRESIRVCLEEAGCDVEHLGPGVGGDYSLQQLMFVVMKNVASYLIGPVHCHNIDCIVLLTALHY